MVDGQVHLAFSEEVPAGGNDIRRTRQKRQKDDADSDRFEAFHETSSWPWCEMKNIPGFFICQVKNVLGRRRSVRPKRPPDFWNNGLCWKDKNGNITVTTDNSNEDDFVDYSEKDVNWVGYSMFYDKLAAEEEKLADLISGF